MSREREALHPLFRESCARDRLPAPQAPPLLPPAPGCWILTSPATSCATCRRASCTSPNCRGSRLPRTTWRKCLKKKMVCGASRALPRAACLLPGTRPPSHPCPPAATNWIGLRKLQELDLSDNKLTELPALFMHSFKSLSSLNVSRNNLKVFPDPWACPLVSSQTPGPAP